MSANRRAAGRGLIALVLLGGCDSSQGIGPEPPTRTEHPPAFTLELRTILPTPMRPEGVAITPDGSQVIVSTFRGRQTLFLDGETYETVRELDAPESWGVEVTPDGQRALIGTKTGFVARSLPDGEPVIASNVRARRVVSNASSSAYFTSGNVFEEGLPSAVVRFDTTGRITARRSTGGNQDNVCFVLTPDDRDVLAGRFSDGKLLVMDSFILRIRSEIAVEELRGAWCLLIPLDSPGLVAVLGGGGFSGEPVTISTVDYRQGAVIARHIFDDESSDVLTCGVGNPWTRLGTGEIVVPTNQGFLLLDPNTGGIDRFISDVDGPAWNTRCCEVAYDPIRRRLIVVGDTNENFFPGPGRFTGRVAVYDVVEGP